MGHRSVVRERLWPASTGLHLDIQWWLLRWEKQATQKAIHAASERACILPFRQLLNPRHANKPNA